MCVAVWFRMTSMRRSVDWAQRTLSPTAIDPPRTVPKCRTVVTEPLRVFDLEFDAGRKRVVDHARIADLAALLGVEVRAVEQQGRRLPGRERAGADDFVVDDPAENGRVAKVADRTSASRPSRAGRPSRR